MNKNLGKTKVVVIREEFVTLMGCWKKAAIINQFLYWSERVNDIDQFIIEENERREHQGQGPIKLQNGWIYKTARQLSEELMCISERSILKYVNKIVEKKYLNKRQNPTCRWDHTLQYRVDILLVAKDLAKIGYSLQGFPKLLPILSTGESASLPSRI